MRDVYILAVHTLRFGKFPNRSIKDLSEEAVRCCLEDGMLDKRRIQAAWFSNSCWGELGKQSTIRGQVALRGAGIDGIPITNIENACAGGSTAFHHAWLAVASGLYDISLAVGAEKTYSNNKYSMFANFLGGLDIENIAAILRRLSEFSMDDTDRRSLARHLGDFPPDPGSFAGKKRMSPGAIWKDVRDRLVTAARLYETLGYDNLKRLKAFMSGAHSPFMDVYGYAARGHMRKYGSTVRHLAMIASKNHFHSSLNPNAQYRFVISPDEVLRDRMVTWPLTRSMCAPVGDGAAAAVLCDERTAKTLNGLSRAVRVRASVLGSGRERTDDEQSIASRLSSRAYEVAGTGPGDIDLAEVHDATAFGELYQSEELGFCGKGEGGVLAGSGATRIDGKKPINTSGGLESRGHPVGASGLAQIHELVTQLRGEAGDRQVVGARLALAENGGGALGNEEAAMCIHILERPQRK